MSTPASIPWFAAHELRLAWRDWLAMTTGGRKVRGIVLFAVLGLFYLALHWLAATLLLPRIAGGIVADRQTLLLVSGTGLLFWTVMLSQALESVTRAFYARSDLDLILSSPASPARLFAVRTGAIAFSSIALACLLASPVINTLVAHKGPRWLAAYGTLAGLGALAVALALLVTIGLFRSVGPRRTRLIAQIIAGIVGAGFLIGIQTAAILGFHSLDRYAVLQSPDLAAAMPGPENPLWLPARAALGELGPMLLVLLLGFGALGLVIRLTAGSFATLAIAAAGVSQTRVRQGAAKPFRQASQRHALRLKEWRLLRRDPWLLSQTLMQILYLIPPALLLWISYGQDAGAYVVVVPVIVMAAGQLAGGLSWLAISGEDAYDLVVTAPIPPHAVLVAKIEAVLTAIAVVFAPILLLLALGSARLAVETGLFVALSAGSATAIQLWFRTPMRRSMFRRRQVASRAATISEALSSIMWAGSAGVLAAGIAWLALLPAALALIVLAIAYSLSPKGRRV